jgi:peptidoglycan/LPS O-acetylase OafA/YrhL
MKSFTDQKQERQYYIDWLRILLILSVFLFHIGMIFNSWPWHIKNDMQYGGFLKQIMTFLHSWRMPLLFMLSGAGTYFALGKRTPGQYLSERFKRLLIPLLLSQYLLRPYFETETNNLVSDWASMSYYIIFFLSGYILLPVRNITEAMRKYRLWYLAEVIAITVFMFSVPRVVESETLSDLIWDVSSIFLAWSCAMTAIGFAKQFLNRDSEIRRLSNEAIYPFYLLHQPVIVVAGYFVVQ